MRVLVLPLLLLPIVASAACPIEQCDYADPQFKEALSRYQNCVTTLLENYQKAMRAMAIMYPRFGIAWSALESEDGAAIHADSETELRQVRNRAPTPPAALNDI